MSVSFSLSKGFTDENSKWLKLAKRKRKIDEPENADDSDEYWEEDVTEEEEEEQKLGKKGLKDQGSKAAKLGETKAEQEEDDDSEDEDGDDDDEDDDEEMVDDYGTLDDGSGDEVAEEDSDGEEVCFHCQPALNTFASFFQLYS